LTSGVPVTGLAESRGTGVVYSITVPSGANSLTFKTSGQVGDADIYASFGSAPTTSNYQKISDGDTDYETITFTRPKAGTYYVLLQAYKTFSGVTLTGTVK